MSGQHRDVPIVRAPREAWRNGTHASGARNVPEETAVAFTYNRSTHAVMMATPADLEDFAIGFSVNERIVGAASEIEALEIRPTENGIELRMTLGEARGDAFNERRRFLAGPTGCGLCGIDSLEEAMRPPLRVASDLSVSSADIRTALATLAPAQAMNRQTHAVHGAAYWEKTEGLVALREDVGRHNALDKLAGALLRRGRRAQSGLVLLTSRVSVELVQKAAAMGAPVLVAVSAPTALAVRTAQDAGITLVGVAREDGFEVFAHPHRIADGAEKHVA